MSTKAKEVRPMADAELETEKVTKASVLSRLADWKHRLEKLFEAIEIWRKKIALEYQSQPFFNEQLLEESMKQFNIKPGKLPGYTLIKGKHKITFMPSNLWTIGANGRVDITSNGIQYILVDMGGKGDRPSDWKIVSRDFRKVLVAFDVQTFKRILEKKPI